MLFLSLKFLVTGFHTSLLLCIFFEAKQRFCDMNVFFLILNFPVKSLTARALENAPMIISFSCSHSDCSTYSNEKSECCQLKFKPLEKVHCFKINNGFFRQNLCLHNLCISQRLQFELLDGTGGVNFSVCEPPSILENL